MPESDKDRELEELKQRVAELENSERPARGVAFHDVARKADKGSQVYYLVIFIVIPRSFTPHVAVRVIGASVILFFGVIALALGFLLPGLIALGLVAADVGALVRARSSSPDGEAA